MSPPSFLPALLVLGLLWRSSTASPINGKGPSLSERATGTVWTMPTDYKTVDQFASDIGTTDWTWGQEYCSVQAAERRRSFSESAVDLQHPRRGPRPAPTWNPEVDLSAPAEDEDTLVLAANNTTLGRYARRSQQKRDDPPSGSDSILNILFNAGAYDSSGAGGAGFYASPIDLSSATSVSFSYWTFFPSDFDFVKGGKLPGLYGGTTGCSGDNSATDCFSTRMMWRTDGAGELYLYAQRDKQAANVCAMVYGGDGCTGVEGMSIDRGAFTWGRSKWYEITQEIVLNTPGDTDGAFAIWYNGGLVIEASTGVSYRNSVTVTFAGIMSEWFYGGSSASWAPTTEQRIFFANPSLVIHS